MSRALKQTKHTEAALERGDDRRAGGEVSAAPEPDLRLEEAVDRRRGGGFRRRGRQGVESRG